MISFPKAKVNLGLRVLGKRNDGFHEIESVLYPVPMKDILEVVRGDQADTLSFSGLAIDCSPGENLVTKSVNLIRENYHVPPLSIHLHKTIPTGAGLGGGSSDAAGIFRMLKDIFLPEIGQAELTGYASKAGSDCPFFLHDTPMVARGRGELLAPLSIDLSNFHILIVKPSFSISTAFAYSRDGLAGKPHSPAKAVKGDIAGWKNELLNDFEAPLFEVYPELHTIKETMYERGAVYASLTGSGSALYGLFGALPDISLFGEYFTWTGKL
jgi:4-diphosphocytidyl-2-C-methyl-D-erythritol kinase